MSPIRPALKPRILLPLGLGLLLVFAATLSLTQTAAQQPSATYTGGGLSVTIPYDSATPGPGRLTTEILDPEGQVLGRAVRAVSAAKGQAAWQQRIVPDSPVPFDDIVWQRLRYRFVYTNHAAPDIEGIEPVSQILRRPVVRILGQSQYLAGSQAAIRAIVSDASRDDATPTPIESGTLRIELVVPDAGAGQKPKPLFSGPLNSRGTLEAQFRFPAGLTGKADLHYIADTPVGSTEYTQTITLTDKASILLTTEKPIYQPGQTIHVRALALDRAAHTSDAARPLIFELEDSRGNKVFKKSTATDSFGIASAEFALADEVNLGTYHLRALMGDSNSAEVALNVERYVLPKFKVEVEFTEANHKPKRDFRPGDHVTGTVHANYFFGKPVDHAEITLKATSLDVAIFDAATSLGKTDADGAYHFDLKLPDYFAGRPLSQGSARALVEATVKDSADHSETRGEPITVSQSALLVMAVPEGGTLVPHMENQVFVLTSYPDGTPAATSLIAYTSGINPQRQVVATDSAGVAIVHLNPGSGAPALQVEADDHHGNRVSTAVPLQTRGGTDQILLRTSRAVVKAGDPIELKVLSTHASGSAYIDIVRNGQTILTRDLDLQNGEASLTLTATPAMAGTLDLDAYLFGRDAQPIADHRLMFVQPADELHIATSTDAASYKPGSDARIRFHVTNAHGEGVSAALGLQVVDEAVFALAEKQPGFARVFFYLEQEVMKPRYEIHSISLPDAIESRNPPAAGGDDARNLAARALFAATDMASPTRLDTEFGRTLPRQKFDEYQLRYTQAFTSQVQSLATLLTSSLAAHSADLPAAFNHITLADGTRPRDPWNTPLRIEPAQWNPRNTKLYRVVSAGPDRRFDTSDDLVLYLEDRPGAHTVAPPAGSSPAFAIQIEHDRGPMNAFAETTGTITDQTGTVIPQATVTLRNLASNQTRSTRSNAAGRFTFSAIDAGQYEAHITSPGFMELAHRFVVQPRDRAILTSTLTVGAVTEMIAVNGAVPLDTIRVVPPPPPPPPVPVMLMGRAMAAAPMAAAKAMDSGSAVRLGMANESFAVLKKSAAPAAEPAAPHIRSYFPEALYINPEILTDAHGDASISIPIADSITTWRMAMLASTRSGALGTGTSSIKVFQDFFVDLDLPITLTQGDRVSLPVGIYNYSGARGKVSLKLQPDPWYTLDDDSAEKSLDVDSGRVAGSQFTVNANRIGKFKLTLTAHMDGPAPHDGSARGHDDIVVREIEVIPNGREQSLVFNGRLEDTAAHTLAFPKDSIADASSILVRLYPGPLSQVIEGMDSILRMPGGCFEQTSSSTYPNVLALDYMKRTKKLTPEVHAKAEGYIANGYQRLLTFEVPGGGFSWFGQAPANKILTSYGLMEFNDMSKVSDVDPKLIDRTRQWLIRQQQADGSWKPDSSFINEGATNRYNSNVLRITAYIAWSLANTGYQGPALDQAKRYLQSHSDNRPDAYTLAIIANFAADLKSDRDFTRQSMQALLDARTERDGQVFWSADETAVYATGASAAIETTGLAAQALLKWGQASETTRKALAYIAAKKQAAGNWGTTQATITSLRALLLASSLSASDVRGTVHVVLNGHTVETLKLNADNNDLLHQFVFKQGFDPTSSSSLQLKFEGTGGLAYQVVGRYFTPWEQKPPSEALAIDVAYDRTHLARNDIATAKVTIRNNLDKTANMVMVDLGIPPGFDLLSEDLQAFEEKTTGAHGGHLEKFSLTATQAILYFDALTPRQTVAFNIRLRARYPIRARTFQSRVYEYYDPAVTATARPIQLEIARP